MNNKILNFRNIYSCSHHDGLYRIKDNHRKGDRPWRSASSGGICLVKGSSAGTVTDSNGAYRITVNHPDGILVFTFTGYTKVEEKIRERTVINVQMKEDAEALQEMVVAGYGSKKERASKSYDMALL